MLQVRERTVHHNIAVINQKSTNTCDVVYAPLRCICLSLSRCAAPVVLLRALSLFVSAASTASIRKIITLDMIEYTAEYITYYIPEVPVATASGR